MGLSGPATVTAEVLLAHITTKETKAGGIWFGVHSLFSVLRMEHQGCVMPGMCCPSPSPGFYPDRLPVRAFFLSPVTRPR